MNRSRNSQSRRTARAGTPGALAAVAALSLTAASCAPDKMPFSSSETFTFAGGVESDGKGLNQGYASYMRYCYACHGEQGNGKGPSSAGLRPPPRDFTKGIFKFARLRSSDELPHDEDLVRIVKNGLHGTAMLAWDIPDTELANVIQYIKTFSPKWTKKKKNGEPVKTLEPFEAGEDPWAGKEAEAVELGKQLYHLRAECLNCHPGYGTKEELYKLSVESEKRDPEKFKALTGFRDDLYHSVAKDSAEYDVRLLPPDFTVNQVRSVRDDHKAADLYRLISFGVYPVMPAWKGAGLSDKEIWAISYYVKSLMELRNTKGAIELKDRFANQGDFKIPAPPAEAKPDGATAPAEGDKGASAEPDKKGDAEEKKGEAAAGEKKDAAAKSAPDGKTEGKGDKKPSGEKKPPAPKPTAAPVTPPQ